MFKPKIQENTVENTSRKCKKPLKSVTWSDSETLDGKELKFQP